MDSQSGLAQLELMKHVERAVRPVCGTWKQKMQMRAELLARLTPLYEEEFAHLGDARAAALQAIERVGSSAELSAQFQRSVSRRTYWECKFAQAFIGRPDESAFRRAAGVAAFVVLLLLLGFAIRLLCVLAGLVPKEFPFSWAGAGEEMIVKPVGTFLVALFLSLEQRLVQARRRGLALVLAAATGPVVFSMGLMSFGPAHVFSRAALADEAIIAWLGLILVPVIMFGVIIQLETKWRQDGEWDNLAID